MAVLQKVNWKQFTFFFVNVTTIRPFMILTPKKFNRFNCQFERSREPLQNKDGFKTH